MIDEMQAYIWSAQKGIENISKFKKRIPTPTFSLFIIKYTG